MSVALSHAPAGRAAGSAVDRWLAGGASALLGMGVVAAAAGAAGDSVVLLIVGGGLAGVALIVLMAPRWIEPTLVIAVAIPLPTLWSGGGLRITGAAPVAAAVLAAWPLYRAVRRSPVRTGALPLRALALLGLVCVAATVASPHPAVAARELANLLVLAGLLFVATDLLSGAGALRMRLATVLALLGGVCGALAALQTVGILPSPFPIPGTPYARAALGFDQPNGLGLYLAIALPLVVWKAGGARGPARLLWGALLACVAAGLLGTASRGSWGAVILGVGALAVAGAWARSLRLVGGVLLAALVLDVASGGLVRDRIGATIGDWAVEQRAGLMLAGILMFLDRPLLGFGPGGFEPELERFGLMVPDLFDFQATPHNAYVQWAAETGVVGLVVYVALLVVLMRAGARALKESADDAEAAFNRALLWCMGVIVVSGFAIWPYALDTGQIVVLIFALVATAGAGSSTRSAVAAR